MFSKETLDKVKLAKQFIESNRKPNRQINTRA